MRRIIAFLLFLAPVAALAQIQGGVQQSGSVTAGNVATWTRNGVIQDGGAAGSSIVPGSTVAVCATAGSILYSDGALVQCAGAVKATSLALGGATIGANALAVTGTANISGVVTTGYSSSANTWLFTSTYNGGSNFTGWAVADVNTAKFIVNGTSATDSGSIIVSFASGAEGLYINKGFGIGTPAGSPDVFQVRTAAATLQHGQADVASGAISQTITAQSNTGAATTGPAFSIKGAGGGSGASVGGSLDLYGGVTSAAAGTGGAIRFYTAPAGAGNAPSLALTIDSTKLATHTGPVVVQTDGIIAGTSNLVIKSNTNTNEQVLFGYDRTGGYGFLQAVLQGTSYKPFVVNPSGSGLSVGTTSDPGNGMIYTNSATFMIRTKTSYTNGAAAAVGTITNAPAAGNPTKWIPVDDNGTTRYVPAW